MTIVTIARVWQPYATINQQPREEKHLARRMAHMATDCFDRAAGELMSDRCLRMSYDVSGYWMLLCSSFSRQTLNTSTQLEQIQFLLTVDW